MASFAHEISVRACCRRREEGADTFLDISTAEALFCAELLDPLSREGMVDTKALVKVLTAGLRSEASIMTAAAVCLVSTAGKVAHDEVSVDDVKRLFRRSFHEQRGSDDRISLATLTSSDTFKAWAVAAGFDATSTAHDVDRQQRANNFNDFEELSRLCERGGAQSAICLLKSTWLQTKFAEAQRTGVPFKLPSRNALPPDAAYSGPITKERVYIIALSYCWAGPGQPDPENRLLADVCELAQVPGHVEAFRGGPSEHQGSDHWQQGGAGLLGLPMLIPEVRHVDRRRYPAAARELPAWPGVDQRPVRSRGHPLLAVHQELSGGGAQRVQRLSVAVLRDARIDLDQGSEQGCRPAHRARVGPPCWQGSRTMPTNDNKSIFWLFQHVRRATRSLPVGPDTFDAEIVRKHATNGSDVQFLMKKFRETFHALMGPAQKIETGQHSGTNVAPVAALPDRDAARVSSSRAHRLIQERGDQGRDIAAFRLPPGHVGALGRLHVCRVRWQPRATPESAQAQECFSSTAAWRWRAVLSHWRTCRILKMVNVEACFGLVGGLLCRRCRN